MFSTTVSVTYVIIRLVFFLAFSLVLLSILDREDGKKRSCRKIIDYISGIC
jgi:hypothetical protein